ANFPSLHKLDQRFAFLDDVSGKFACGRVADVLRRMRRAGRNEEDVTGLQRGRRLAFELIFQRAREHVDDLLAGMAMAGERHAWLDIDARLNGLMSGNAEVLALQVGARAARRPALA